MRRPARGLAQWPTSWSHLNTGLLTPAGGAEVVSLSFLGLFLFPALLLEKRLVVAEQFLKGETMAVYQVEAATSELQPAELQLGLQLAGGRRYPSSPP